MKKGVLSLVLALCLLTAGLPASADTVYSELTHETNGGTITFGVERGGEYLSVKAAEGLVGDVVLPAQVNGITVRQVSTEEPCQGEGCTIGAYIPPAKGFAGCSEMTSLTIPGTVEEMRAGNGSPFEGCDSLRKVVIEEGNLTWIGPGSFDDCPLESITIPDTVEKIDPRFTNSRFLKEIRFSPGNPSFSLDSRNVVYNRNQTKVITALAARSLEPSLVLPETVTEIGAYAFYNHTELTEINLPARVKKLEEGAFAGCTSLNRLTLSPGVTDYPPYAFQGCSALEEVSLPEGVIVIRTGAFRQCSSLKKVELPSTLTHLVDSCFRECEALKSITLPPTLQRLDNNVFDGSGLTELTVPGTVKSVEQFALYGCKNLKQVTIQEGVKFLEYCAFSNCPSLEKAYLPESLKGVYDYDEPKWWDTYPRVFAGAAENFAIYAKEGSYAQRYARKAGLNFVSTGLVYAPFTDIRNHWSKDSVDWAYRNVVVFGTTPTLFEPDKHVTRAMVAAILARYDGGELPEYENSFQDCVWNAYYYSPVTWMEANGIASGTSPTTFSPHRDITREELASMLYRYVRYLELDTSTDETLASFADAGQVHDWALEAIQWAVGAGIIEGRDSSRLEPRGTATRAECVAMLQRLDALLPAS